MPSPARLSELLQSALDRRSPLDRQGTTLYRLVHKLGDGLPGVAVDRLSDVLVLHVFAGDVDEQAVARALLDVLPSTRAVYVKRHPREAGRLALGGLDQLAPPLPLLGEPQPEVAAKENGLCFLLRPSNGLSYGLFPDMREVRGWVQRHARDRSVLNLFAYTCGFGVAALRGGARRVLNLDLSRPMLEWGKESYALNDLPVDPRDFVYGDASDWLKRFARRGETFDMVILDPPSFSRGPAGALSVERVYARLVAGTARVVAPGGLLLAATNHAGLSTSRFEALLRAGIQDAGRDGRVARTWHEPAVDFPRPAGGQPALKVAAVLLGAQTPHGEVSVRATGAYPTHRSS